MTLEETLARLESFGSKKVRAQNRKNGADNNQFFSSCFTIPQVGETDTPQPMDVAGECLL